jgi:hypothetical protein
MTLKEQKLKMSANKKLRILGPKRLTAENK